MAKNIQPLMSLFSPEIQKEINKIPQEIFKKKKEIECVGKEIINIKEKLKIIDNQLKKSNKELITEEEKLSELLIKKYWFKVKQKKILSSINKELFAKLMEEIEYNSNYRNIKEIFLLFFNFKDKYKDELKFIIQNKGAFIELMNNSYKNIKLLFKENINQFNEKKKQILNLIEINRNESNFNNKNNQNNMIDVDDINYKIKNHLDIFIEFISNSFEKLSYKYKIKQINNYIEKINTKKNSILLNKILLENNLEEKELKIINLDIYCKNSYIIIEKYNSLRNVENKKEIINILSVLQQSSIPFKSQLKKEKIKEKNINVNKEKKDKAFNEYKISNDKNKENTKEKERENTKEKEKEKELEKNKTKNNISSQERNINNKILYISNKINNSLPFNKSQNHRLKESSYTEIYKNYKFKGNINTNFAKKLKIDINNSPERKIKKYGNINNNKTINPKKKKYFYNNEPLIIEKSSEKQKINKIFLPSRFVPKNRANIINSYSNLLLKEYHKSPTSEINHINKYMDISEDRVLKTEEGNKYIHLNLKHNKSLRKIFIKK